MNAIDQFRLNADSYLEVSSTDFTRQVMATPPSVAVSCFDNKLLGTFRVSLAIGGALIASGIYHLVLLWMTSADWSGPVSLRKPGLFGVSAGMTVWSIAWVLTQLVPRRNDPLFATLLSVGLLLEVARSPLALQSNDTFRCHDRVDHAWIDTARHSWDCVVVFQIAPAFADA